MAFKTIVLSCLFVFGASFAERTIMRHNLTECTKENALFAVKRPIYEFSVSLLDRVAMETKGHFVYSPLSTWSELMAIADGAFGRTLSEILNVTNIPTRRRQKCLRKLFSMVLNDLEDGLKGNLKKIGLVIVDKLFKAKKHFKTEIEMQNDKKVLSLDFDEADQSAIEANDIVRLATNGAIEEVVFPGDFNISAMFLTEAVHFKSDWKFPFDKDQTSLKPFYDEENVKIGNITMMNQVSYFNVTVIPLINSRVVELPFANERVSMLVFLPLEEIKYSSIKDFYYYAQDTNLVGILNRLKIDGPKFVNVSLPRFEVLTAVEENELLYDMGLKRIFYPDLAKLKGVSDYTLSVSLLSQVSKMTVTEESVTVSAKTVPQLFVDTDESKIVQFNANRPFAFMIVDKPTHLILFAGMYSAPQSNEEDNNYIDYGTYE